MSITTGSPAKNAIPNPAMTEDPQSWNLYSYGRNNPFVMVDPNGEYVCGNSLTSAQCDNFQKTIDAYGKQGVDSGVTIAQGRVGAETVQTVVAGAAGAKTADNPNGQNITVTTRLRTC